MNKDVYHVGGYVKLAKLWEKRSQEAIVYHKKYYKEKFCESSQYLLSEVYIDITGNKKISKRENMIRLLRDCANGKINCIAAQTKAYLAADAREFCYLIKLLFDMNDGIELITEDEDYHIDTIRNAENQKEDLYDMAESYIALNPSDFSKWYENITKIIGKE